MRMTRTIHWCVIGLVRKIVLAILQTLQDRFHYWSPKQPTETTGFIFNTWNDWSKLEWMISLYFVHNIRKWLREKNRLIFFKEPCSLPPPQENTTERVSVSDQRPQKASNLKDCWPSRLNRSFEATKVKSNVSHNRFIPITFASQCIDVNQPDLHLTQRVNVSHQSSILSSANEQELRAKNWSRS